LDSKPPYHYHCDLEAKPIIPVKCVDENCKKSHICTVIEAPGCGRIRECYHDYYDDFMRGRVFHSHCHNDTNNSVCRLCHVDDCCEAEDCIQMPCYNGECRMDQTVAIAHWNNYSTIKYSYLLIKKDGV